MIPEYVLHIQNNTNGLTKVCTTQLSHNLVFHSSGSRKDWGSSKWPCIRTHLPVFGNTAINAAVFSNIEICLLIPAICNNLLINNKRRITNKLKLTSEGVNGYFPFKNSRTNKIILRTVYCFNVAPQVALAPSADNWPYLNIGPTLCYNAKKIACLEFEVLTQSILRYLRFYTVYCISYWHVRLEVARFQDHKWRH